MLFKKIIIEKSPGTDPKIPYWYMILRSYDDVIEYMKLDSELFIKALVNLPENLQKSHLSGPREVVLNATLEAKSLSGERISPLEVTAEIISNKTQNMLKIIDSGKTIQINSKGGYSDHETFMKIWKDHGLKVLVEIEKDSTYFPAESESENSDLVFLENDERIEVQFENDVYSKLKLNNKRVVRVTQLKETDPTWLFASLMKTENIAFITQYANPAQNDSMFELFLKLPKRNFIIRSQYKDQIMEHPQFDQLNNLHTINWI